jgi:hypothetical protein
VAERFAEKGAKAGAPNGKVTVKVKGAQIKSLCGNLETCTSAAEAALTLLR